MNGLDFTAIDFETANEKHYSCCSLGLIVVRKGEILLSKKYLIQPPNNHYINKNILIHKISPLDTKDSPFFPIIWEEIKNLICNQLVIAHNVDFDKSVLINTLKYYGLETPDLRTDCTFSIYKMSLDECCYHYDIPLEHHNPLSDATACAMLYLKYLNHEVSNKEIISGNFQKNKPALIYHEPIRKDLLKPNFEDADSSSPFFMKKVVITGIFSLFTREKIAEILKGKGADINSSISSKTDFIIAGKECGPSKYEKAAKLGVPIITEEEFIRMIR